LDTKASAAKRCRGLRSNDAHWLGAVLKRDCFKLNRNNALASCLSMIPRVKPEDMLFRKPVPTFRDHALSTRRQFFAQDLKLQPLFLRGSNLALKLTEFDAGPFKRGAVPGIEVWIVEPLL
jgi:hypothetical protein